MNLTGSQLLDEIESRDPKLGKFLRNFVLASINNVALQAGVSAVGKLARPDPPQGVNISQSGEYLHVSINDNGIVQKGMRYFVHIANNPQFSQPLVLDYGASRTREPHLLPTKDGSGNTLKYYVRAFRQMPGSDASEPIVYGGAIPAAITMGGSTQMTLLPSTGSGTGANNGQSGAVGLGTVFTRPPAQPKRKVSHP